MLFLGSYVRSKRVVVSYHPSVNRYLVQTECGMQHGEALASMTLSALTKDSKSLTNFLPTFVSTIGQSVNFFMFL